MVPFQLLKTKLKSNLYWPTSSQGNPYHQETSNSFYLQQLALKTIPTTKLTLQMNPTNHVKSSWMVSSTVKCTCLPIHTVLLPKAPPRRVHWLTVEPMVA